MASTEAFNQTGSNEPQLTDDRIALSDFFMSSAYIYCSIVISVVTIVGNVLVLIALGRRVMRLSTTIFVASLATGDCIIGFLHIFSIYVTAFTKDDQTILLCVAIPFIYFTCIISTSISMAWIAIERHRAVVEVHKKPFTTKQTIGMVIIGWIFSLVHGSENSITFDRKLACFYLCNTTLSMYFRILDTLLVLIPCAITCVLYYKTIRKLYQQHKVHPTNGQDQKFRLIFSFMLCVVVYVLCFIPINIVWLFTYCMAQLQFGIQPKAYASRDIGRARIVLMLLNSMANPIIYVTLSRQIR